MISVVVLTIEPSSFWVLICWFGIANMTAFHVQFLLLEKYNETLEFDIWLVVLARVHSLTIYAISCTLWLTGVDGSLGI